MTYLTYSEFVEAYKKYLHTVITKWLTSNEVMQELYLGSKITITLQYDSSGGMDLKIKIVKHMGYYRSKFK